jgi:hypothetical protein
MMKEILEGKMGPFMSLPSGDRSRSERPPLSASAHFCYEAPRAIVMDSSEAQGRFLPVTSSEGLRKEDQRNKWGRKYVASQKVVFKRLI